MTLVISKVTLTNLAFNEKDPSQLPLPVEISRNIDDRYVAVIKVGDWVTKITKEDLSRII